MANEQVYMLPIPIPELPAVEPDTCNWGIALPMIGKLLDMAAESSGY